MDTNIRMGLAGVFNLQTGLLKQQNEDGSFARSWNAGKGTVNELQEK